jgi:hypothetical protein
MPTASDTTPAVRATPRPTRPTWRRGAATALAASLVNAGVWLVGRVAGVDLVVHPGGGGATTEVGLLAVVLTTAAVLAVGWVALWTAARWSRAWVTAVLAAGAVIALATTAGPLTAAVDPASGLLLALMHLVAGAAFVGSGARVRG